MVVWCISFFLLCFKAAKNMFPIMCAEALVGLMNIQLRQTNATEKVYWQLVVSSFRPQRPNILSM